jgi:hypothetical protein
MGHLLLSPAEVSEKPGVESAGAAFWCSCKCRSQLAISPPWQDITLPVPAYIVAAIRGESDDEISAKIAVMDRIPRMI